MATSLAGQKIAMIGLGRSGLGVGRAVLQLGGNASIFDSKPRSELTKPELAYEAEKLGLDLRFEWDGDLGNKSFAAVIVNPAIDPRSPLFQKLLSSGVPIWSEIEFAYRISSTPIIAITGTNGKSTTAVLTFLALEACGAKPVLCGNIFGSGYPEMTLTDAALISGEDQVLVAEVSSFQLEQISSFRPVAAAITNIVPDHQDRYNQFSDYAAAKMRIFEFQSFDDFAVIPLDDAEVTKPAVPKTLTFGWSRAGNAGVINDHLELLDISIDLRDLPFAEQKHNVLNAMTAGLLASAYLARRTGDLVGHEQIFEGFKKFKGLAHRMEFLGEREGIRVINNSMCTNPEAVMSSSQAVRGRQHLLIGGVNKGLDFTELGSFLKRLGHAAYVFGRDRISISTELGQFPAFETMRQAFEASTVVAKAGETIMLAPGCASSDQFRDFRDRGDVFREFALAWIRENS